jgi:hypothetical protein
MAQLRFRVRLDAPAAKRTINGAFDREVKKKCDIVRAEGTLAAQRIRDKGFGPRTDVPEYGALRTRSANALLTIGSTYEESRKGCVVTVGSIKPSPEVRTYLHTHEPEPGVLKTTIYPKVRGKYKLAFPHGDDGPPGRDARGVQQLTLSQFKKVYKRLGYAGYVVTKGAVFARRKGSRALERIFILRESVTIPARRPISRQIKPTLAALRRALGVEGA